MFESNECANLERVIKDIFNQLDFKPELIQCDHICYVVKDQSRFNTLKDYLAVRGSKVREISQSEKFRGNSFYISTLHKPISFMGYQVNLLELKLTNYPEFNEGWQHAEFISSNL